MDDQEIGRIGCLEAAVIGLLVFFLGYLVFLAAGCR